MHIKELLNLFDIESCEDFIINKFETNSKLVEDNDVFIAINNGINYIDEAIANGAKAVIVDNGEKYECLTINVDSSINALGKIASYIRSKYHGKVIAITGSCGKTTTKELISSILSTKYRVLKSEKNYNNHIGLPLTLLSLDNSYDYAVVELGMNHQGEIEYLSKICKPNIAVITNIGTAHIGNLGSIKNIYKAKMEVLEGLNGNLYVNNDDKYLRKVKYEDTIKVSSKTMGITNINYYLDKTEFDLNNHHFIFHVPGKAVLNDLLLAIKIGMDMKIDLETMQDIIYNFKAMDGRLNIVNKDYILIDDSYNSSYEALVNSLNVIKTSDKKKYIVLGDMLELGKYSKKYHKKVNKYLNRITNKQVLLVGEYTRYINGIHFDNIDGIINYLKNSLKSNDLLYIKGSRAMRLDKIKDYFAK